MQLPESLLFFGLCSDDNVERELDLLSSRNTLVRLRLSNWLQNRLLPQRADFCAETETSLQRATRRDLRVLDRDVLTSL
jgi:hypothetical protein